MNIYIYIAGYFNSIKMLTHFFLNNNYSFFRITECNLITLSSQFFYRRKSQMGH